jgi:hypothetical protein
VNADAALKRRSSTVVHTFVQVSFELPRTL